MATWVLTLATPSRLRRLSGEVLWVGLGQAVAAIGGLAGVRLLTDALGATAYGELALGTTVATWMQQVVFGPVTVAALRFFAAAREAEQLAGFRGALDQMLRKASILALLSGLLLLPWVSWQIALPALLYAFFSSVCGVLEGAQSAARQRAVTAIHQGLGQCLRFSFALALAYQAGRTGSVAITGYALASLIVLASQFTFFQRSMPHGPTDPMEVAVWRHKMTAYALPFAGWAVFSAGQLASDRWALQAFRTTHDVGLYQALYQVGFVPFLLLSNALQQLVAPILFARAGDSEDAERVAAARLYSTRLTYATLAVTIIATAVAGWQHKQIFSLLAAAEFLPVSALLPYMVLAAGLFAAGQAATLVFLSETNSRRLLWPKIGCALLAILLNFAGAQRSGVAGVVAANVLWTAVYCGWLLLLTRRRAA